MQANRTACCLSSSHNNATIGVTRAQVNRSVTVISQSSLPADAAEWKHKTDADNNNQFTEACTQKQRQPFDKRNYKIGWWGFLEQMQKMTQTWLQYPSLSDYANYDYAILGWV